MFPRGSRYDSEPVLSNQSVVIRELIGICAFALSLCAAEAPKIGDVPPPLQLGAILQGPAKEEVSWNALKGKVVIVEFWNTACAPCVAAIPHWNDLVARFSSEPVVFLSLSDDNPDHLKKFLKNKPISGWVALDAPLRPTAADFAVFGIPHTVLVDRNGRIAAVTHPDHLKPEHIQELLDGKPSSLPPRATFTAPMTAAESPNIALPTKIEVSITGPFPKPNGAYASRSWKFNCIFQADKAPVSDILATFFRVSEKLLPPIDFGEEELYSATAGAPPEKLHELQTEFIRAAREKWNLDIEPVRREFDVYLMTIANTNAPALKPVRMRSGGGQTTGGFALGGSPIRVVASYLELSLDKPVINETQLDGLWATELKWEMSAEELAGKARPDPAKVIKAAREQLGLDLRPANRELPTLKIRQSQ
jgi:uncharacterized protein (TIGR03435 family)